VRTPGTADPPVVGRARWAVLASLTVVSFLLLLDDSAVSIALPAIRQQLHLGLSGLEWVINGYTLPVAALMLLSGKLADRHDRRRVFLHGVAVFTLASLLAGLADQTALLIAARALQGVGAALMTPASLSIIATTFSERERGSALGVWAGVSATALGLGPVLGALVTSSLGWSWIFLLNVPLCAGAWLIAHAVLPASRPARSKLPLDLRGAAASCVGLTGLLLALTEGNDFGWTSPRILALTAVAAAGIGAFIAIELRARDPLMDLSLLRDKTFAGPNIVILLATSVMCSLFFFLALYLQNVLGYGALAAGAALLPLTLAIVLVAPLAGRLADRIGPRAPVTTGMLLLAAALLGLAGLRVNSSLSSIVPWLALAGAGIGLTTTPTTTAAMANTSAERHGLAAGVLNTFRWTGLALGIALMGAVLSSAGAGAIHHNAAFVDGFSDAVTINAAIALAGAAAAALTLATRHRPARNPPLERAPAAPQRQALAISAGNPEGVGAPA
jgi:EmrB/QacA subfamily drug resistance transporter